jgi:hypothetical protein
MKLKNTSLTILLYIIWLIILIMRISLHSFEEVWLWLILVFVILAIKDVLIYMVDIKPTKKISYDRNKIKKGWLYYYLLINRVYIFPFFLALYLIYLLIKQTHVYNLNNNIFYLILNENFLLAIVIISGILTIRHEWADKKYQKKSTSLWSTYLHIGLSIILSLLGVYIILWQVVILGWIGYVISGIAGILIFLIWILIIEEDDEEVNNKL